MFPTMFKPEECTSLLEVTGEVSFDPRRFNFHERVRERDWMKWRELNFTTLHHLSVFVPESRQIDFNCQWWLFNDVFTTSKASSYCLNSAQTQHRKKKKKKERYQSKAAASRPEETVEDGGMFTGETTHHSPWWFDRMWHKHCRR